MEVEDEVEFALRRARTIVLMAQFKIRPIVAAAARVGHQPGTPAYQSHANMNLERTSQPAPGWPLFIKLNFDKLIKFVLFSIKRLFC